MIVLCLTLACLSFSVFADSDNVKSRSHQYIVYTANQGFLSRIYLLRMDGSVYKFFEYTNYRFMGLEVVNDELYAAEAFAPRVLKVDLDDGSLDVIVDDWSLFYFYNIAFDGTYFYLDEWDLNRYYFDGTKAGTASFDGTVRGSAWDGSYLWIQKDENKIECWDISAWPTLTEIDENSFTPPSPDCCGLWYDGQYFWTAESIEDNLGNIYQFDYQGQIINQWNEPAYSGWGACLIIFNAAPYMPGSPEPDDDAIEISIDTNLGWLCTDPEGDSVYFDVYLGNTQPPPLVSSGQIESAYDPEQDLEYETVYYWQIIARDNFGDSTVGPLWSFTTEGLPICGDADGEGNVNISDAVYTINYVFAGGDPPDPYETGDCNCDGECNVSDAVWIINFIFSGGNNPCDTDGDGQPDC